MKKLDILLAKCQHILNTTTDVRSDADRVLKILDKCNKLTSLIDNPIVAQSYGWAILGTMDRYMSMIYV